MTSEAAQNDGRTQTTAHAQGEAIAKKRSWRIASILALAVVAALLVAFLAFFLERRGRQSEEPQVSASTVADYVSTLRLRNGGVGDALRVAPVAVISIDALLANYRENEFAAAAKYEETWPLQQECLVGLRSDGCRVVDSAGTIRDMGRGARGVAHITLATAEPFYSVEALFGEAEEDSLRALRRGQRVSVRCMVHYDPTTYRSSAGLLLTRCGVVP